jgi:branched-chain amino acid transport system permease protein
MKNFIVKDNRFKYIVFGAVMAFLLVLQEAGVMTSATILIIGTTLIYSIGTMGLDALQGYSGLFSLGTAGFMGLAAYVSAYCTTIVGLPFEVGALIAVGMTIGIGAVVGLISLRVQGIYLAIATLIVSEILLKTFEELVWFTNSFTGQEVEYPTLLGIFELDRKTTYLFVVVIVVILMIITENMKNSRSGRALNAIRQSEVAAQAMGINLLKTRLTAFVYATAFAAIAGVLYGAFINFVYPTTWIITLSLSFMASVVIGGSRSVAGNILGAFIVFGFPDLVIKKIPVLSEMSGFTMIFTGALIILIVLKYPHGLIHFPMQIIDKIKASRKGGDR